MLKDFRFLFSKRLDRYILKLFYPWYFSLDGKQNIFRDLVITMILPVSILFWNCLQGDQIKQFFANWATFGDSLSFFERIK
jgi:hypothetical protein